MDAGPPPTPPEPAACTLAEATDILADGAAPLTACFDECSTNSDCLETCLADRTGARVGCTQCFGQLVRCGSMRCLSECSGGASPDCTACLCAEGCDAELDACAGVDAPLCTDCTVGPENTPAACGDGCSNDDDEWADCMDYDCSGVGSCPARGDPPCAGPSSPENTPSACSDGCSNDGDLWADCADWDCGGIGECPVPDGGAGCVPACSGRECGSDGCGGTCGTCPSGEDCTSAGRCEDPDACTYDSQCGYREACRSGRCQSVECTSDSHCASCNRCSDNVCRYCGMGPYGCYC